MIDTAACADVTLAVGGLDGLSEAPSPGNGGSRPLQDL